MINRIRVVTLLVMVLGGIRTVTAYFRQSVFFFPSP
ncbi:Uncharacterised protein [Escherichia coli]|nr:Uncharacterised protein [Escherichia coli]